MKENPPAMEPIVVECDLPYPPAQVWRALTEQDLLVVQVPKRSQHPLMLICQALLAAEINIHYAYPLLISPGGPALAMYVDDPTLAAQLFIKKGFTLIGESDLGK